MARGNRDRIIKNKGDLVTRLAIAAAVDPGTIYANAQLLLQKLPKRCFLK